MLESECLFVVSYAIIYFSKNMDFTGRCESTITVVHNSLSQIFLIFFDIYLYIGCYVLLCRRKYCKPDPDSTGEKSRGNVGVLTGHGFKSVPK